MGLMRGIGKAISGVVKGVKKVFKKVTSSKLGKALLIGATVFMGGAALGFWNVPAAVPWASKINGAFVGGGAGTGTATTATTAAEGASVGAKGLSVATKAPIESSVATATKVSGLPSSGSVVATEAAKGASAEALAGGATKAAVQTTAREGILNRLMSGAKTALQKTTGFVQEHPYASALMVNAAAGALTPDEQDLMEASWKREDQERERRERNQNVSGIDLGFEPIDRTADDFLARR